MAESMDEIPEDFGSEVDYEPPVVELRQLPDETQDDFLERVRRVIRRNMLGSHVVDICIVGSALVLLQLLFMVGQLGRQDRDPGGDE